MPDDGERIEEVRTPVIRGGKVVRIERKQVRIKEYKREPEVPKRIRIKYECDNPEPPKPIPAVDRRDDAVDLDDD